jgi:hypothetical protein
MRSIRNATMQICLTLAVLPRLVSSWSCGLLPFQQAAAEPPVWGQGSFGKRYPSGRFQQLQAEPLLTVCTLCMCQGTPCTTSSRYVACGMLCHTNNVQRSITTAISNSFSLSVPERSASSDHAAVGAPPRQITDHHSLPGRPQQK